ncbi:MAG: transglycosylase SLT domain-containing protein [Magnetococcales bacterium]|nr:transglycosylase SLT domain-containing protein [Magnetococcales bacterium]MBF0309611.1 transglycosylase SLT domain-containing protein [Magnetococcales bacterium]
MKPHGPFPQRLPALLLTLFILSACSTTPTSPPVPTPTAPPKRTDDACAIFSEKKEWYPLAKKSFRKWGAPLHVMLAIMHQESRFQHDAIPPKGRIMGVIPWGRASSAYGYSQALDGTWDWYREKTGNWGADRDDFGDAIDFMGWYIDQSHQMLGISKWDTYNQYLAYHEGQQGYKKKTFQKKAWLIDVSRKVDRNAARYEKQLAACESQLRKEEGSSGKGGDWWPF